MKTLLLLLLIGIPLPGESDVVSYCYACGPPECGDPFDTSKYEPNLCPLNSSYCLKTKAPDGSVTRSCYLGAGCLEGSSCCTTDNCNSGTKTSFSAIMMMISLLMAYIDKARF